ncbi:hypothetical protein DFA_07904 [Cavenderia fasciculata]|uniref:Uncharacterized protein n=1 Tax=Cavenderia fasciculata TaxID=261658 RepID=F4Q409_CACFS|nr:uncharacterized protein DFA_07904 [Cavenderia fasciculata]EGG16923.1 hypothetical protein DFA_07904 [Cavenderia fasciculata]|eukprot:XP_004355397.1 hypothetical protein DFA_07904 [Cavenderia fasciculata]
MYMYLPIDILKEEYEGENHQSIETQRLRFAQTIGVQLDEQAEEKEKDNYNKGGRRRSRSPRGRSDEEDEETEDEGRSIEFSPSSHGKNTRIVNKKLNIFHNQKGWTGIYAFSKNQSPEVSITVEQLPMGTALCLYATTGYILPYAIIRHSIIVKDNIASVTELEIHNATITSYSTGGSGGEDYFTENISIEGCGLYIERNVCIDLQTGEFTQNNETRYHWLTGESGRTGEKPKSLVDLAKLSIIEQGDPEKIALAKQVGIITEEDLQKRGSYDFYVLTHENPSTLKHVNVVGQPTLANILDHLSNALKQKIVTIYSVNTRSDITELDLRLGEIPSTIIAQNDKGECYGF